MKYPHVIFLRYSIYSSVDYKIKEAINEKKLNFTITIASNLAVVQKLFRENYNILITFGNDKDEYKDIEHIIPQRLQSLWIHQKNFNNVAEINNIVNFYFMNNVVGERANTRPVFSIFTTCYKSYKKIIRAYNSVISQSFIDWEWIILDDSPGDEHFDYLQSNLTDKRIRLYKRSENSGIIGNVKNEAVSMCRGKYCVELDHDDELVTTCLSDALEAFDNHPDVGFVYMDFINMTEDRKPLQYTNSIVGNGYAGYYAMKYEDNWHYVFITPNINNITLSHLSSCPNHPRIWDRQVLLDIGNYSEQLPIGDDYELLLRTCIKTKTLKLCKVGYIQFFNRDNNNFSIIRSDEINRLCENHITPHFFRKYNVQGIMEKLGASEDPMYDSNYTNIWERDSLCYQHKFANYRASFDYDTQILIIGRERLKNSDVTKYIEQIRTEVFVIDANNDLNSIITIADSLGYSNIRCCSLQQGNTETIKKFFDTMCRSCENVITLE